MTRALRLVPASPEPTVGDRVMLGAEVGRAIRFSMAAFTAPGVAPEEQVRAALTVMRDHTSRLDARRPGWLEVARGVGWLP